MKNNIEMLILPFIWKINSKQNQNKMFSGELIFSSTHE